MSEDQRQNMPSQPVTPESLAAQMRQMMTEFREFRAFAEPKLYDAKPLHEQTRAEVIEMRQEMNQRFERLEKELRQPNHKFENQMSDPANARADVRDLQQPLTTSKGRSRNQSG